MPKARLIGRVQNLRADAKAVNDRNVGGTTPLTTDRHFAAMTFGNNLKLLLVALFAAAT
jgi:hypothetical protein